MAAIVTHVELLDIEPEPAEVLSSLLGAHHMVERRSPAAAHGGRRSARDAESDERLLWMRDYQPLWVRRADGTLKAVRYLADTPYRSAYLPTRRARAHSHRGRYRYFSMPGRRPAGRWLLSETLPLLHENGNLVSTGPLAFVTDLLVHENSRAIDDPRLLRAGYRSRTERETLDLLARAIERPRSDLVVLPQMPGEATGHVDAFVLALDRHTVMVPEIRAEAMKLESSDQTSPSVGREAQAFLDEVAAILQDRVPRVLRLPMLAPIEMYVDSSENPEFVIVSPANALLVPVGEVRVVLLPRFDLSDFDSGYRRLDRRYRREWERLFSTLGWSPITVESTHLAINQGLLRCASFPIPR